jgi:hypothetical protein
LSVAVRTERQAVVVTETTSGGVVRLPGEGDTTPAGFEMFFADLAELMASMPPGPRDMSRTAAVYEKCGLRVVGPPPSSDR